MGVMAGGKEEGRERERMRMPVWWEEWLLLDLTGHSCFNEVMRSWNRPGRRPLGPGAAAAMRHGWDRSDEAGESSAT